MIRIFIEYQFYKKILSFIWNYKNKLFTLQHHY